MSHSISSLIIKLTNDYETHEFEVDRYSEICARFDLDPQAPDTSRKLAREVNKVEELVQRHLETQVGEFQVENRETQKMATLTVTRFVGVQDYEFYNAWLDEGITPRICGYTKLEISKRLPSGNYWSAAWRKHGREVLPSEAHKQAPSHVYVHQIRTYGNSFAGGSLRGTGSGLMQIAAEVCQQYIPGDHRTPQTRVKIEAIAQATLGCFGLHADVQGVCLGYLGLSQPDFGIHVLLQASYNSPGFYRTAHFTTGHENRDRIIDDELASAKQKGCQPNTSSFGGTMYLDDAGRAYYAQQILENPILQRSILPPT